MKKLMLLLLLYSNITLSSMENSYQSGKEFASQNLNQFQEIVKESVLKEVPGFKGVDVEESRLDKNGHFETSIRTRLNENEAAKSLYNVSNTRQRFNLDLTTDPLFKELKTSSDKALGIEEVEEKEKGSIIEKTCEEGGEDIEYLCHENRIVDPQVPMKSSNMTISHLNFEPNIESYQYRVSKGKWNKHAQYETRTQQNGWKVRLPVSMQNFRQTFCHHFQPTYAHNGIERPIDCSRIQSYQVHSIKSALESNGSLDIITEAQNLNITLVHDTYEGEGISGWQNNCQSFESKVDEGLCQYAERTLTQGPEKRNIKGYLIYQPSWQYARKYQCKMLKDECSPLKAVGCYQIASNCKEMRQGKCWIYKQKFHCPDGKIKQKSFKTTDNNAFCLTGNCSDASYMANTEMLDTVSKLNILKQMQQEIKVQGVQSLQLFKGSDNRCSRNCINFKDCCGGMKGWGLSLKLAGCTEEEKQLALLRQKHLCVQVGTYCAKKGFFKKCLSKKTSYCCFASRLARILQEQGRAQLGIQWGTAECPVCRGFTMDELTRIDMSKMQLQEIYEDIMKNYKAPDLNTIMLKTGQQVKENIKNLSQGVKGKESNAKGGLLDENKKDL